MAQQCTVGNTPVDRRTALKIAGAGLVTGTFTPELASANGNTTFDATFHLLEGKFPDLGFPLVKSKTEGRNGRVFMAHGSGIFDQDGDDVDGGGSFRVVDSGGNLLSDGEWTANRVVEWDPYGFDSTNEFPESWKGGFLELEIILEPDGTAPPGIEDGDNLNISCHQGLSSEDDQHFPSQGIRIGEYTDVLVPFTLYHYTERKGG